MLNLHQIEQFKAATEQWAGLVKRWKVLMTAGDKAEAKKLLPEIERLAKLIAALEGGTT